MTSIPATHSATSGRDGCPFVHVTGVTRGIDGLNSTGSPRTAIPTTSSGEYARTWSSGRRSSTLSPGGRSHAPGPQSAKHMCCPRISRKCGGATPSCRATSQGGGVTDWHAIQSITSVNRAFRTCENRSRSSRISAMKSESPSAWYAQVRNARFTEVLLWIACQPVTPDPGRWLDSWAWLRRTYVISWGSTCA